MASIGIPPGTIGVLFITRYNTPVQSFINFSNVARKKPGGSSTPDHNIILPWQLPPQPFQSNEPSLIKVGVV